VVIPGAPPAAPAPAPGPHRARHLARVVHEGVRGGGASVVWTRVGLVVLLAGLLLALLYLALLALGTPLFALGPVGSRS
jgi:hypothetical protein